MEPVVVPEPSVDLLSVDAESSLPDVMATDNNETDQLKGSFDVAGSLEAAGTSLVEAPTVGVNSVEEAQSLPSPSLNLEGQSLVSEFGTLSPSAPGPDPAPAPGGDTSNQVSRNNSPMMRTASPMNAGDGSIAQSMDSIADDNSIQEGSSMEIQTQQKSTQDDPALDGRVINTSKQTKAKQSISEAVYLQEFYSGRSSTPAFLGTGDVWGRGTISDVISLVRKQKLRQTKRDLAILKRKSGLGLLESSGDVGFFFQEEVSNDVATRPDQEVFGSQQMKMQEMQEPLADRLVKQLPELKGIGKLRFVKMKQLTTMAREEYAVDEPTKPSAAGISGPESATSSKTNVGKNNSNNSSSKENKSAKGSSYDYSAVDSEPLSLEAEIDALNSKRDALDLPERVVTCLSTATNMKYMHIGNKGLEMLAQELVDDIQITSLVLSCARVTCTGICAFASCLEMMRGLTYLDLTQNGIADAGAIALADAIANASIEKQVVSDSVLSTEPVMRPKHPLKVLLLAGNRIGYEGASKLVQVLLHSGTNVKKLR